MGQQGGGGTGMEQGWKRMKQGGIGLFFSQGGLSLSQGLVSLPEESLGGLSPVAATREATAWSLQAQRQEVLVPLI